MSVLLCADVAAMIKHLSLAADPTTSAPLVERRQLLLRGIGAVVAADAWIWLTGQANSALRGEVKAVSLADGGWRDAQERARVFKALSHPAVRGLIAGITQDALSRPSNLTRARVDVMDDAMWRACEACREWRAGGFDEFVASIHLLEESTYSAVGFCRRVGAPAFTDRERSILETMFPHIEWVHRTAINLPNCAGVAELSPREREVLLLLLEGDARKQVAAKLKLSAYTVADHLKLIYKKLGVTSRAELLSRFIHGGK